MKDLSRIAEELGLASQHLLFYGRDKAKVSLAALAGRPAQGRLILVSAITPTPAGEGKTTVSIGLAQGLKKNWSLRRTGVARTIHGARLWSQGWGDGWRSE